MKRQPEESKELEHLRTKMLIIDENPELEFSEDGLDSYFVRFNTTKQE